MVTRYRSRRAASLSAAAGRTPRCQGVSASRPSSTAAMAAPSYFASASTALRSSDSAMWQPVSVTESPYASGSALTISWASQRSSSSCHAAIIPTSSGRSARMGKQASKAKSSQ